MTPSHGHNLIGKKRLLTPTEEESPRAVAAPQQWTPAWAAITCSGPWHRDGRMQIRHNSVYISAIKQSFLTDSKQVDKNIHESEGYEYRDNSASSTFEHILVCVQNFVTNYQQHTAYWWSLTGCSDEWLICSSATQEMAPWLSAHSNHRPTLCPGFLQWPNYFRKRT